MAETAPRADSVRNNPSHSRPREIADPGTQRRGVWKPEVLSGMGLGVAKDRSFAVRRDSNTQAS
ncbi:predicted protein [Uncinocarpus reesii 1704]|uniref:Uncharacterized protein n=1 Tax=Uncinocarpus reesii (strain UAMH 1704) TaxID=336963 RepID=C4JET9_UNCRE|nr:uncharacterized protein UREG_02249 [Uncinocarpus reesii 1704]EEP77400.1 predicted protein [Uncinocarpus reesii 1704]